MPHEPERQPGAIDTSAVSTSDQPVARFGRASADAALVAWLYVAELCLALLVISLHKKGERPLATFLVAPAGLGLLVALAMLTVSAVAVFSRFRRRHETGALAFAAAVMLNVLTVSGMLIIGETAIRLFTISTPAGPSFANTVLLPKDWKTLAARDRATLQTAASRGSYLVFDTTLGWAIGRSRRSIDPYRRYRTQAMQQALGTPDDIYLSSVEGLRSPVAGMSFGDARAKHRIALIGDSFTFGLEVHFEDTWGRQLERTLGPESQVLNFGVDGYGLDQAVLRYRRDVVPWHPDIVILSVINDDLRRTMCVYGFLCFPTFGEIPFPKPRFVLAGDSLQLLSKALPDPTAIFSAASIADLPFIDHDASYTPADWEWHFYDHSRLIRYVFSRLPHWPEAGPANTAAAMMSINGALFQQFIRLARENGSIPIVVFLPSGLDFTPEAEGSVGAARAVLKANAIAFHDLMACVQQVPAANRFVIQHYSATTNRAVAECLAPAVRQAQQISDSTRRH